MDVDHVSRFLEAIMATGGETPVGPPVGVPSRRPDNEAERVETLRRLEILDTDAEPVHDDLVKLASTLCDVPIAMISMVDSDRQWFVGPIGLGCRETSREVSFCSHAIVSPDEVFVVEDTWLDERFRRNPLVLGEPHARFYAAAPIRLKDGVAVGTICVMDRRPRRLDPTQHAALAALGRQAAALMELRLQTRLAEQRAEALRLAGEQAREERRTSAELLDLVLRGGQLSLWEVDIPSGRFIADRRARAMVGAPEDAPLDGIDWRAMVHPEDLPAVFEAYADAERRRVDHCVTEHRIRHGDGPWIWVLACASIVERDANGAARRIVGTHMNITSRVENRRVLKRTSELLRKTGAMAKVGGWEYDLTTGKIGWTDEVYALHDLPTTVDPELLEVLAAYPEPGRSELEAAIGRAVSDGEPYDLELEILSSKGRRRHVRAIGEASRVDGVTVSLSGTIQDITDRKSAELVAAAHKRQLALVTDHMPALIAYVDAERRFRFLNAYGEQLLGANYARAGTTVRAARGEETYAQLEPWIDAALAGRKVEFSYTERHGSGELQRRSSYIPDVDAQGRVAGFYVMSVDITELHQNQRRLESLARQDALTGLPNRREFDERIAEALRRAAHESGSLAVMFLDVDHFKSVNDTHGHAAGDAVLCEFARRLREQLRHTDTIARVSGDEFVVICDALHDRRAAETLAGKIVEGMSRPFDVPGGPIRVTTSIGVAIGGGEGVERAELLARADAALYEAKRGGRGRYAIAAAA